MDMPGEIVVELYRALEADGVMIWIDGGWAVDALLEQQTRRHDDLDIVVQTKDLDKTVAYLRQLGYTDVPRDDTRPCNFVLGNQNGHEVDFHVIELDINGDGIFGPPENGEFYPAYALTGWGKINGQPVRCMSLEYQLLNHTGYRIRDKDIYDVRVLCERFEVTPPDEYKGLRGKS
jgi:lincosamide nucleotidyltransferase A/C/D/E